MSNVDRRRTAPRNVMAVITKTENNLYQLEAKPGVVQKLHAQNDFQLSNNQFMSISDVHNQTNSPRIVEEIESK